jgi:hypothetical protein
VVPTTKKSTARRWSACWRTNRHQERWLELRDRAQGIVLAYRQGLA